MAPAPSNDEPPLALRLRDRRRHRFYLPDASGKGREGGYGGSDADAAEHEQTDRRAPGDWGAASDDGSEEFNEARYAAASRKHPRLEMSGDATMGTCAVPVRVAGGGSLACCHSATLTRPSHCLPQEPFEDVVDDTSAVAALLNLHGSGSAVRSAAAVAPGPSRTTSSGAPSPGASSIYPWPPQQAT